ncbi:hypothetical protein A4A49_12394 [Nicotiana attenuata]|uniref:Putative plant transposon protein domain-containing protein n=1 Tax=Nicotiana attenuata TaxID=49451 RepID=A0A314KY01_NICAT|nr:hypothetical protein A4A49_12394 [Nicotiana attenuata]
MPPRKDTGKGKATTTSQAKAKATSAPLPKKRKGGEATSSMTGAQAVAAVAVMRQQPPGQWEFGINSIPPHTRDWYKRCRPKHIHLEGAIQERSVKAKYPAIWKGIQDLGLSYVFKNTGDINLNLVREFYAGFDPQDNEELVPIRGRLIDFSAKAICDFLGSPNVPVEPLEQFIRRPTYRELRHTLCGHEGVEEEPDFDHTIDKLIRQTDITNLWLKDEAGTPSLTCAERNACDDSFMAHLYGMMDLQLRIGGRPATSEERTDLEQRYPLNAHAQQLVGVGEGYRLPADEDVNTPKQFEAEPMQSDGEGGGDDGEDEHDEEWRASEDDDAA